MVLTAYGALSPVIGFLVTAGVMREHYRQMPASRHQDHTLSPSVNTRRRLSAWLTSTASQPNVPDDREAPLLTGRDGAKL